MLEEEFQTADTRPKPFPWSAVVVVVLLAGMAGAALMAAALRAGGGSWWRVVPAPVIGVVLAWSELRRRVREWQRAYGVAVEYVARRKREREGGLRFEAP